MNILDFDKWSDTVNEGFKADINSENENENEKNRRNTGRGTE